MSIFNRLLAFSCLSLIISGVAIADNPPACPSIKDVPNQGVYYDSGHWSAMFKVSTVFPDGFVHTTLKDPKDSETALTLTSAALQTANAKGSAKKVTTDGGSYYWQCDYDFEPNPNISGISVNSKSFRSTNSLTEAPILASVQPSIQEKHKLFESHH